MKRALIIFGVVLIAYALTAGGHLYSQDEELVFRTTRSLALGRGLAIEPLGQTGFGTRKANPERPDKLEYAQYGIGQPIMAVPFYWVGAALGRGQDNASTLSTWRRLYGDPALKPDVLGFQPIPSELAPRWACSWFNVGLGALIAVLLYLVCLEITGSEAASTWAALLYALGSLAWPHSRPFFTEVCSAFWILLAWYGLLRASRASSEPRGRALAWCALAGAAAGYAALTRLDSIFAYPALGLLLVGPIVAAARRAGRPFWPVWAAFCIPAAAAGAVLIALNHAHFGGLLQTGYADQPEGVHFNSPLAAGLFGFLFSPGKGIFFFSPALVPGLWGWRHLAARAKDSDSRQRHPALVWAVALAILVPLAAHAKWQNWAGGWCWGPRHVFAIHAFLAIPLAALLARVRGPAMRVTALVALIAGMAVQLLGCSQDFIRFYQLFFRTPGNPQAAFVVYDPFDEQFWSQHYQLLFRMTPGEEPRPLRLFPPRPIQDSIYIPQASVWSGYPLMLHKYDLDNFWVNLTEPAPASRAGASPGEGAP